MTQSQILEPHDLDIIVTGDGSKTLRDKRTGLSYRSTSGANTESRTVFFGCSRLMAREHPWTIVELGFGGALNFLQTVTHASGRVNYIAVDKNPVPPEVLQGSGGETELAREVLALCRERQKPATVQDNGISLTLYPTCWSRTSLGDVRADAFYFDPFSPLDNPDAWTTECFAWAALHCQQDAVLSTYSAQGQMRRRMRDAGFYVASAPGYGKKREFTVASKSLEALAGYKLKYRP